MQSRAALLLVVLLLAGCAGTGADRDQDGVVDAEDAFPDDPREVRDTDGDGIGDFADPDADNDGTPDEQDRAPLRDAHLNLTIRGFELMDEIGGVASTHVRFELLMDDVLVARLPAEPLFAEVGVRAQLEINHTLDLPDDATVTRVTLRVVGGPDAQTDIDVHASPGEEALAWSITTASGAIAGAAAVGPSSGAGDGDGAPDGWLDYVVVVPTR